jgi:hypothetical protein
MLYRPSFPGGNSAVRAKIDARGKWTAPLVVAARTATFGAVKIPFKAGADGHSCDDGGETTSLGG